MEINMVHKAVLALALVAVAGVANSNPITRLYGDTLVNNGSGTVTYTGSGQQLKIEFDNTSANTDFGTYLNSSVINGLVFDVNEDISAITVASFKDGNNADLTSKYVVELNVDNNITPGSTVVDLSIKTDKGIKGGIYNALAPGSELNNVFPDVATLILNITTPATDWDLVGISNDILRMQRVGPDGKGSLKLPGYNDGEDPPSAIPEPGILSLLGLSLAGVAMFRRRQS